MLIHFIGPGGAGKTSLAKQFAIDFGAIYYDLDEHFMLRIGDISQFIAKYSYKEYAIKNIELYRSLITTLNPDLINIIVCSSGFMTYPNELMDNYEEIKTQIEESSLTFLLLPSFELEICVKEIVRRQLQREYLNCSSGNEEKKIRNRFPLYINLKCQRILTNEQPSKIAFELYKKIFIDKILFKPFNKNTMLETDRLILKPFLDKDLPIMIEMFQNKDFMAFSPYSALSTEAATRRFLEILEHYKNHNFGKMAIVLRDTHKIIGYCGFETCEVDGKTETELGFRLIKSERNKGYIVEASLKLLEDMKNRNFKHVIAFSEKDNLPAHNLLNKLGFEKTNSSSYMNMDVIFFRKEL